MQTRRFWVHPAAPAFAIPKIGALHVAGGATADVVAIASDRCRSRSAGADAPGPLRSRPERWLQRAAQAGD